ncbi:MAG: sodium/proton-translocating pyrophosphatase [Armatimonadetes bacterium]|nr:sodium/proton-translocating pyrophosphatase [Armatimonadota bacterium]
MRLTNSSLYNKLGALFLAIAFLVMPSLALASEENVVLSFGQQDMLYLVVSGVIGILAIIVALAIRSKVLAQSPGDDRMKEVGKAINDGAMAYLAKQRNTISVFVVLLGIGLGALFTSRYDVKTGVAMALAFVGGVAASYIAGYMGMTMAVAANMRTAAAALTKFSKSLETAFRAGAVAGLFTVGMGLIGATVIFFVGGPSAMRLLIGFGFGGSLAALFMRVGGGIFTKAADVGADLVGKVEAGIPEDDPRNPAVIADNVGDNVGDCAGMAADVFESYEVTLVAAIVLGAATASLFDQSTWMKLILFALMARGVGIIASVFGVFMVKGSDNVDDDALKPISRGFLGSASIATVLTLVLAYVMMGGTGAKISSTQFTTPEQIQFDHTKKILDVRDKLAARLKEETYQVKADEIIREPEIKEMFPVEAEAQNAIQMALSTRADQLKKPEPLSGYTKVDWADKNNPVVNYASQYTPIDEMLKQGQNPSTPPKPTISTLGERFASGDYRIFKVELTSTPFTQPGQPKPAPTVNTVFFGPITKVDLDKVVSEATKRGQGQKIEVKGDGYPVSFYANRDGKVVAGVSDPSNEVKLDRVGNAIQLSYYKEPVDKVKKMVEEQAANPSQMPPPMEQISNVSVKFKPVEWWRFFLCIFFGIVMASMFERLTDYYVSTHKKPVKEVADVATAGPAPMIIQGFALGLESSFFSVAAIVVCLIMPLLIFNPMDYGNYILSFYGIALVGLGLLTTTGYILAMDTFGPISDNAQGVFEMSGAGHDDPVASKGIQRLDAAGNTTKALTKGFAIATAVVAATALFHSYVEQTMLEGIGMRIDVPEIFLGFLIGGAAPFLFSAFSINAVGRAAFQLINEVRAQFKADPGIMKGTSKPDYGRCVAIVTAAAQRELMGPGILAIALPIVVAFGFSIGKAPTEIGGHMYNLTGAQALGGFLAGCILSGQLMAVLLANSGGIWDNAKKLIEDGLHGGKGTEAHKAGVVCDTVGDPFKDTAGPALNPLIKVMNLIALLLAPYIIMPLSTPILVAITVVGLAALAFSIAFSKRASIGSEMASANASAAAPAVESKKAAKAPEAPAPEPEPEKEES